MIVPSANDLRRAWRAMPCETRDRIGCIALDMVFQGFLGGEAYAREDRVLQDQAAQGAAQERSTARLNEIYRMFEEALPDLFGPPGENPAWAYEPAEAAHA